MIELALKSIFRSFESSLYINPHQTPTAYIDFAQVDLADILTPTLVSTLHTQIDVSGYAIISTDLGDSAPATPADYRDDYGGPYYAEAALALIGETLGTLCNYSVQHNGRTFHDIMPMKSHSTKQTFASSAVDLEMHTELAFVENPPDYLMLFCIRSDREGLAETHLYDSRFAYTLIPEEMRKRLREPGYLFAVDEGATVEETSTVGTHQHAIFDKKSMELLRYDLDLCRPSKPIYADALSNLNESLLGMKITVRLRPGQLLVLNNRRIVHSRNVFKAHFDGRDRWLKRAFVRKT